MRIRSRTGEADIAGRDLATQMALGKKLASDLWELAVGSYLLGHLSEAEFLHTAARRSPNREGHLCEAWFYIGMKHLLAQDRIVAHDFFQRCIAIGQDDEDEYNFATADKKFWIPRPVAKSQLPPAVEARSANCNMPTGALQKWRFA